MLRFRVVLLPPFPLALRSRAAWQCVSGGPICLSSNRGGAGWSRVVSTRGRIEEKGRSMLRVEPDANWRHLKSAASMNTCLSFRHPY